MLVHKEESPAAELARTGLPSWTKDAIEEMCQLLKPMVIKQREEEEKIIGPPHVASLTLIQH
jgi:hypothetical protein